jgi:hypothetical protein
MVEIGPSPQKERQSQAISIRKSEVAQALGNGATWNYSSQQRSLNQKSFAAEIIRWEREPRFPKRLSRLFYAKGASSVTIWPNTLGLAAMTSPLYR